MKPNKPPDREPSISGAILYVALILVLASLFAAIILAAVLTW